LSRPILSSFASAQLHPEQSPLFVICSLSILPPPFLFCFCGPLDIDWCLPPHTRSSRYVVGPLFFVCPIPRPQAFRYRPPPGRLPISKTYTSFKCVLPLLIIFVPVFPLSLGSSPSKLFLCVLLRSSPRFCSPFFSSPLFRLLSFSFRLGYGEHVPSEFGLEYFQAWSFSGKRTFLCTPSLFFLFYSPIDQFHGYVLCFSLYLFSRAFEPHPLLHADPFLSGSWLALLPPPSSPPRALNPFFPPSSSCSLNRQIVCTPTRRYSPLLTASQSCQRVVLFSPPMLVFDGICFSFPGSLFPFLAFLFAFLVVQFFFRFFTFFPRPRLCDHFVSHVRSRKASPRNRCKRDLFSLLPLAFSLCAPHCLTCLLSMLLACLFLSSWIPHGKPR